MNAPSIERISSRTRTMTQYPIARHMARMPVLGSYARAWVRATSAGAPRTLWASLPPVAA